VERDLHFNENVIAVCSGSKTGCPVDTESMLTGGQRVAIWNVLTLNFLGVKPLPVLDLKRFDILGTCIVRKEAQDISK
ncbi:hypothetical protein QYM36_008648, partial [Artemia franciscana]